jgi:hypothetical protein
MSSARIPPVEPFQDGVVIAELNVADVYCGTSTTWNVLAPFVAVRAAVV